MFPGVTGCVRLSHRHMPPREWNPNLQFMPSPPELCLLPVEDDRVQWHHGLHYLLDVSTFVLVLTMLDKQSVLDMLTFSFIEPVCVLWAAVGLSLSLYCTSFWDCCSESIPGLQFVPHEFNVYVNSFSTCMHQCVIWLCQLVCVNCLLWTPVEH